MVVCLLHVRLYLHARLCRFSDCCRTGTRKCTRLPPSFFHAEIACSYNCPFVWFSASLSVRRLRSALQVRMSAFYLPTLFLHEQPLQSACLSAGFSGLINPRTHVCLPPVCQHCYCMLRSDACPSSTLSLLETVCMPNCMLPACSPAACLACPAVNPQSLFCLPCCLLRIVF
jgi:hypothetical protein